EIITIKPAIIDKVTLKLKKKGEVGLIGKKPPSEDDSLDPASDTEGMLYSLPPATSYEASSNLLDQYVKDERVNITCKTS
ncbi:hypothetical protein LCGC14_1510490, partial [marine sediment metagenome]